MTEQIIYVVVVNKKRIVGVFIDFIQAKNAAAVHINSGVVIKLMHLTGSASNNGTGVYR